MTPYDYTTDNPPSPDATPVCITVSKCVIAKACEIIENGIENTHDLLANHDATLGRSIRRNRVYAEMLEAEIADAQGFLAELWGFIGA